MDQETGKLLSLPITDLYALKKDAENNLKKNRYCLIPLGQNTGPTS